MPFTHHVDPEKGFGLIRLSGTVTGADLLDALAWFYDHADWAPGSRVLWDGRAIESFVVTPEDLHAAAELVGEAVGRLGLDRTAVVAGCLESYMGGSLLAARLGKRTGRAARAFSDYAPALEWLATPSPPLLAEDVLPLDLSGGDGSGLDADLDAEAAVVASGEAGEDAASPEGAD